MTNNKVLAFIGIVAIVITFFAFKSNPPKPSYSYLSIRTYHYDLDEVYLSIGGKEYKKINLKKQQQGTFDLNPLINLINQYENEGWEMQSIVNEVGTGFVWMRRVKE
jgi:hypothetical protein